MEASMLNASRDARPVYEYELPEELQALGDPYVKKTIGLVKLKMSEEMKASDRAQGNQTRLAYQFLMMSLVEVDGRKINKGEAEDEKIVENVDALIRSLMLEAYADMTMADAKIAKKFLGSRKIKV